MLIDLVAGRVTLYAYNCHVILFRCTNYNTIPYSVSSDGCSIRSSYEGDHSNGNKIYDGGHWLDDLKKHLYDKDDESAESRDDPSDEEDGPKSGDGGGNQGSGEGVDESNGEDSGGRSPVGRDSSDEVDGSYYYYTYYYNIFMINILLQRLLLILLQYYYC